MTFERWTQVPQLHDRRVLLRPLTTDDADEFFALCRDDPESFRYLSRCPSPWSADGTRNFLASLTTMPRAAPLAIIDRATNRLVGITSYLDMRPEHRALEIGWTWFAPAARGAGLNHAAKILMLTHAFDTLRCIRVAFTADTRNNRSIAALTRLGARCEGIIRNASIMHDGYIRDSMMFSILDREWSTIAR